MLTEKKAIIFDLDNTLIVEEEATRNAFYAVCNDVSELSQVDLERLFQSVCVHGKKLWSNHILFDYCDNIQITYTEALCADFVGEDPRFEILNKWGPTYRRNTWYNALFDMGVDNLYLAEQLSQRYKKERKERFYIYPNVEKTLEELKKKYQLAILTNGAPDLQRLKIYKVNLEHYFQAIVVSGEVGVGKPSSKIFLEVLEKLNVSPEEAVMVGDNMERDILGANQVGITSIWINHEGSNQIPTIRPTYEIKKIDELMVLFK